MTYEISVFTDSNSFSTRKQLPDMQAAVTWAREFASDWWKGASYSIFCIDTAESATGAAN